jgi:hypothetical protein
MRRLARLFLDYVRHAACFLTASAGVAALTTIVLPVLGFVAFGDRGPAWYGTTMHPTWNALGQLAAYAVALPLFGALPASILFIVPFAVVRALQHFAVPSFVTRTTGALLCAIVAAIIIAGAGWYIALGAAAGGAGVLGATLYGAAVLSRERQAPLAAVGAAATVP